jgi:hypothetical protein
VWSTQTTIDSFHANSIQNESDSGSREPGCVIKAMWVAFHCCKFE